jgi:uncharacterized protein YjbI with pentapeptide repeats
LTLWDKLTRIFEKIPDVTENISKLSDSKELKEHLDKAGSIGGLINFSLFVIQVVRPYFTSKERIAFSQLLEILMFASQQALPDNIKDLKISNVIDKEFTSGLFTYFLEDKWYPYMYASNNNIILRFKEQIRSLLFESDHYLSNQNMMNRFLIGIDDFFNQYLKEKKYQYKELNEMLSRKKAQAAVDEKIKFLQYMHDFKFNKFNQNDDKFLYEYYVENDAWLVESIYWKNEEDNIPKYEKWDINKFLYDPSIIEDHIVIGAPFGIGKSSFGRHIVSKLAAEYLDSSQVNSVSDRVKSSYKYFPIFVPLKHDFFDVYNDKSLDDVLDILTDNGKFKDAKVLCIFDGLDEYKKGASEFYVRLSEYRKSYRGIKSIITTRLEAKYPEELHINKNPQTDQYKKYVRLFSFDKTKIEMFFVKYGISLEYEEIIKVMPDYTILSKPLFCWMIAFTMKNNKSLINLIKSSYPEGVFNNNKTILYFYFIHSIIMGRKYNRHINEEERKIILYEKRALRKIAALTLTEDTATEMKSRETKSVGLSAGLVSKYLEGADDKTIEKIEDDQDGNKMINKTIVSLSTILSTYFFSVSADYTEKKIEFLHKSFSEYLIAEYYIESILDERLHRLNIGLASSETVSFLDDLLKLIYLISKNEMKNDEFVEGFLNSFTFKVNKSLLSKKIIDNCIILIKQPLLAINKEFEGVSFFADITGEQNYAYPSLNIRFEENFERLSNKQVVGDLNIWFSWISKWILLYCISTLKSLDNERYRLNAEFFDVFITLSSLLVPSELKRLRNFELSEATLHGADLSKADLSKADLSKANLSRANFSGANLSRANLSRANLSSSNLSGADFSEADLSSANLYEADLSSAKLSRADLSRANFSGAKLSRANLSLSNLSGADFSEANLSGADFSDDKLYEANFSEANLSRANLSRAKLSRANLSRANLSRADFSEANLSSANLSGADFSEANLSSANLSGADFSEANLSSANFSGANLSSANLYEANLSSTNFSGANLLNTVIFNSKPHNVIVNKHTDFSNSIIDDSEFLKHLHEQRSQNIPNEIKNKQQLREELMRRKWSQEVIDFYLGKSRLPG